MTLPAPLAETTLSPFPGEDRIWAPDSLRPVEEEVWSALRLLTVADIAEDLIGDRFPRLGERTVADLRSKFVSCLRQADEYYQTAKAVSSRIAPLLFYYSMLNVSKALLYSRDPKLLARPESLLHGLTDPDRDKRLSTFRLGRQGVESRRGVFSSLYQVLTATQIPDGTPLGLLCLFRYCSYIGAEVDEAFGVFPRLVKANLSRAANDHEVALRLEILKSDIEYYGSSRGRFERDAPALRTAFRRVASPDARNVLYETEPMPYVLMRHQGEADRQHDQLVQALRPYWSAGYRPDNDYVPVHIPLAQRGVAPPPEMCTLLAITFYFGSLVRYHPHVYDRLLGGKEAWLLENFVRQCPLVFANIALDAITNRLHFFQTA